MRSSWVPIVGIVFFSGAFLLLGVFTIGSALIAGTPIERLGGLVGGSAALVAVLGPWYFFIRETLRGNALLRVLEESHGQLAEGHSIWFDGGASRC